MRKFYQKKELSIEESPLTLQLQRRHTVVEGDKDKASDVSKLKPVCRSNSTSSIYRPPKSAKDLSSQKGYLESTLSVHSSGSSSASTVVITESQLSSSWLYNNKKAQMCPEKSSAAEFSQPALKNGAKFPLTSRPKVKSISSSKSSPRKRSSFCCYAAIVFLAGLVVLGIISAIGGILYLEFFSGSKKVETRKSGQPDADLRYSKKADQLLDAVENHASQDLVSREEILNLSSESKQEPKALNHLKHLNHDNIGKGKIKENGNILKVKKVKKEIISSTEADIPFSVHNTNDQPPKKDSYAEQSFHQGNLPSLGAEKNSPYSKLFELYKDMHTNLSESSSSKEESSKTKVDKINPTDLKADNSKLTENISQISNHHEIESDKRLRSLDESLDSNDSSDESLKPDSDFNLERSLTQSGEVSLSGIPKYFFQKPDDSDTVFRNVFDNKDDSNVDNLEVQPSVFPHKFSDLKENFNDSFNGKLEMNNQKEPFNSEDSSIEFSKPDSNLEVSHIPSGEISGPAIPKNFFQIPTKDDDLDFINMFDIDERIDSENSEETSFSRFLPERPELSEQNDSSDSIASNFDANNQESDLPLELNRPISETKIAFPGPLDLIRRFTMSRESDNKDNSEEEEHDRRFSLAQALERLRSLDVRNILPSSRQNSDSKNSQQKFVPKAQNNQEVVTERSNYLQKLRLHFFNQ